MIPVTLSKFYRVSRVTLSRSWLMGSFVALVISTGWDHRNIDGEELSLSVNQITSGPQNYFFGYIGHCKTIPWNASGRHIVALRVPFHERMPEVGEFAEIVLIDTMDNNAVTVLDRTQAWNLQQGTMLFWNPNQPETQFFFNDVDPTTGVVFTAIYDIEKRRRVREFRFGNQSIANGGVAPTGTFFAGINYGKISRSRSVISYPGAFDWTADGPANPPDDGLFRIDLKTGERKLLVSYAQLSTLLLDNDKNREKLGDPDQYPIYVHHTMWSRDGQWIAFIVRGKQNKRPNVGCAIRVDGTGLRTIPWAGHPEWLEGNLFAMASKEHGAFQVYDVEKEKWNGQLGGQDIFRDTDDDNALSPNGVWMVGSHKQTPQECVYTLFRIRDQLVVRSPIIPTKAGGGDLRLDPAPRWNRTSDALLVPGKVADGTIQLFVMELRPQGPK